MGRTIIKSDTSNFNIALPSSAQLTPVRVLDVILDVEHPKAKDLGYYDALGTIFFTKLNDDTPLEDASNAETAKPIFSFIKNYPLKNEIVLVLGSKSKSYSKKGITTYYLPTLNCWNHPHHNALPSIQTLNDINTTQDYQTAENGMTYRQPEDASTDIDLGQYFEEQINIKPLLPYEGDSILEGRFGNSIRLGATAVSDRINDTSKNNWSKGNNAQNGDPIIIIRNGQDEAETEEGWVATLENINRDPSSIYLTSNQTINNLQVASLNFKTYNAELITPVDLVQQITNPLETSTPAVNTQTVNRPTITANPPAPPITLNAIQEENIVESHVEPPPPPLSEDDDEDELSPWDELFEDEEYTDADLESPYDIEDVYLVGTDEERDPGDEPVENLENIDQTNPQGTGGEGGEGGELEGQVTSSNDNTGNNNDQDNDENNDEEITDGIPKNSVLYGTKDISYPITIFRNGTTRENNGGSPNSKYKITIPPPLPVGQHVKKYVLDPSVNPVNSEIVYLVIHTAAMTGNYTPVEVCESHMHGRAWHDSNGTKYYGWSRCGYHHMVDHNGLVAWTSQPASADVGTGGAAATKVGDLDYTIGIGGDSNQSRGGEENVGWWAPRGTKDETTGRYPNGGGDKFYELYDQPRHLPRAHDSKPRGTVKVININYIGGLTSKVEGGGDGQEYEMNRGKIIYGTKLSNDVSRAQAESLRGMVLAYVKKYPNILVMGHQDVVSKECPWFNVRIYLERIREIPGKCPHTGIPFNIIKPKNILHYRWAKSKSGTRASHIEKKYWQDSVYSADSDKGYPYDKIYKRYHTHAIEMAECVNMPAPWYDVPYDLRSGTNRTIATEFETHTGT